MSPIPRNIVANIIGQGWATGMSLVLVPLYVWLLGVEAYGLIGVYATLQATFQILDLGLTQTMSRQLAYCSAFPEKADEARDFVRTIEIGYWAIGFAIGAATFGAAPVLARDWLNAGTLPVETVEGAIRIMGAVAALQWPLKLYEGGLIGLQRQVLLNGLKISISTVGAIGTVLVLWVVSRTITAYFAWQAVAAGLNVAALAFSLRRSLPAGARGRGLRLDLLAAHWRFAAGMGGIAITGILLSQLDKVILSRLLSLEAFGYYALGSVVASFLPVLVAGSVFNGVFPRLTALAAAGAERELAQLYHRGTQLMAVLVSAFGGVIAVFALEIISAWTRSEATGRVAAPIASMLMVGMGTNALMTMPYALQLAHGWTALGLRINAALLILLVPSLSFLTLRFGAVGAAAAWAMVNALYMVVAVPLTHRRLLKGEMARWFLADILPPVGAALLVVGTARLVVSPRGPLPVVVIELGAILVAALTAAAIAAPLVRSAALDILARWGHGVNGVGR